MQQLYQGFTAIKKKKINRLFWHCQGFAVIKKNFDLTDQIDLADQVEYPFVDGVIKKNVQSAIDAKDMFIVLPRLFDVDTPFISIDITFCDINNNKKIA